LKKSKDHCHHWVAADFAGNLIQFTMVQQQKCLLCHIHQNDISQQQYNHWNNEDTMVEYVSKIISLFTMGKKSG